MIQRRGFIKSSALAVFGVGLAGPIPGFISRALACQNPLIGVTKRKVLICIFQRGAMDGLMAVCPFNDTFLKLARPTLFMSAARNGNNHPLIDLDGRFGLHPSFEGFENLFKQKQLAIVHGIGSPNQSRSHFDAQDLMESGTPFDKSNMTGWLNRASEIMSEKGSAFRAVSLSATLPRSLYGPAPSLAIANLKDFAIRGKKNGTGAGTAARSFEELYDEASSGLLQEKGKETFEAIKMLEGIDASKYQPENGANYPQSPLGNSLQQLAQLIKLNVGLEIGFAESNGWDTHYNQGAANGLFARNAQDFSSSIVAFWTDLGIRYQDDVTVLTMTEFGRTVRQNGSNGTDHGRGSCSFILGNNVKGGQVWGDVPELKLENLADARDLPVTTDFRALFSEVAQTHLGLKKNDKLFPGWEGKSTQIMKL